MKLRKFVWVAFSMLVFATATSAQTAQTFSSPEEAVKGLVAAARSRDLGEIDRILAPEARKLRSNDPIQEAEELALFVQRADEKTDLTKVSETRYELELGNNQSSFPVPIVKRGEQWAFDSTEGLNELLARRVGRNELDTILVCAAYAVAQWDYFLEDDWNADGVQEFAQKFISSPGQKDGLYWTGSSADDQSPLGPLIAYARVEGYQGTRDTSGNIKPVPFHGYYFKILKAQGQSAPGGRYNYMINGRMLAGFALVAYPAVYGSSGVMTFIVNQQGKVYQSNLGPNTERTARAMTEYNPDSGWELVDYRTVLLSRN
jgi:hypothetical protein